MKKPTGVIIAAVLLILLAIIGTLSTISVALVSAIMPHLAVTGRQSRIVAVILFAFFALPTIFTWCVGLGLFRGKNWARISGIVLGSLIALSSAFFALTTVAMMMVPQFRSQFGNARFGLIIGVVFDLLLAAFGVWLAIYLSLRAVRQTFRPNLVYVPNTAAYASPVSFDSAATSLPTPPPAPAYIAVPSLATPETGKGIPLPRIAVLVFVMLSLLGSLSLFGMAAAGMPLFYLGVNLQGHAAALALVTLAAINIVVAIGLFRRFPPAYYAALAMQLLGIVSSLALLSPSFRARTIQASVAFAMHMTPVQPPQMQPAQMQSMMHSIQNGALILNAILVPLVLAFFIWAILRDLASIRNNAASS
jgi:hypothetical protein